MWFNTLCYNYIYGFPGGSDGKESACNARDPGSIPGPARYPGEGNGNPLQCSCLESPRDGGAWWAAVSGVAQGQTLRFLFCPCPASLSQLSWGQALGCSSHPQSNQRERSQADILTRRFRRLKFIHCTHGFIGRDFECFKGY